MSWQEHLHSRLKKIRSKNNDWRLAVVGIGQELRGDDAVGMFLASRLQGEPTRSGRLLAVEAGPAPENFTGTLRRFRPDLVLLVDAAFMNEPAGTIGWLSWQDAAGFSASTHTLPLHLLAEYLTAELGCEVALLGIQPAQLSVGAELTPRVRQSALELCAALRSNLAI